MPPRQWIYLKTEEIKEVIWNSLYYKVRGKDSTGGADVAKRDRRQGMESGTGTRGER
jgi:hypothetical protein